MRSRNLIRALQEDWLPDNERQLLQEGAIAVRDWLAGSKPKPFSVLRCFSVLFLFAQESVSAQKLVQNLCDFLTGESETEPDQPELFPILDGLWADLQDRRIGILLERINAKTSLSHSANPVAFVSRLDDQRLEGLYENKMEGQNIDFFVQKLPFPLEVLDPRIVRIPPGKTNELHRHAHETVFVYLKGSGHAKVDDVKIPVKQGDFVFIPRWCRHQSVNEGSEEMVFLAVADFGLTGKSFFGNYLKTARLKTPG